MSDKPTTKPASDLLVSPRCASQPAAALPPPIAPPPTLNLNRRRQLSLSSQRPPRLPLSHMRTSHPPQVSEEKRLEIMHMVKEGKISPNKAMVPLPTPTLPLTTPNAKEISKAKNRPPFSSPPYLPSWRLARGCC